MAQSNSTRRITVLKQFLLVFWALWFTVVFLSNLADAAKAAGLLSASWPFASGNWQAIHDSTARYGVGDTVNGVLFCGVIVWELVAAALFWRAAVLWSKSSSERTAVYNAFISSICLWGAFLIVDEICIAYVLESTHLGLFTAHLATLLAIELLPET